MTRETDYAIRVLSYMAQKKRLVISSAELQKQLGISRPFLRKIMQILQKEQILFSTKGNKGGFALAQLPSKIYLTDIIGVFQGSMEMVNCVLQHKICPQRKTCALREELKNIEQYAINRLSRVSIADLIKEKSILKTKPKRGKK